MNFIILTLFIVHFGIVSVSAAGTCQCDPPMVVQRGWTIDYYNYPQYLDVDNNTYYVNGFTDYGPAYAHEYEYTPSINYPQWNSDQGLHDLYGVSITTFNFSVVLSGYFQAPETGTYEVQMTADDGAAVQFSEGSNCSQELSLSVLTCGIAQEVRSGYENGGWGVKTTYLNFEKGQYYPVRIIWWQRAAWVEFLFDMTTPSGIKITGFENTIVQLSTKGSYCPGCVPETAISMSALASRSASYFTYSPSQSDTLSNSRLPENSTRLLSEISSSATEKGYISSKDSVASTNASSNSLSNTPVTDTSTSVGQKSNTVPSATKPYFTVSNSTTGAEPSTPTQVSGSASSSLVQSSKFNSLDKSNYSSITMISNDETESTMWLTSCTASISNTRVSEPGESIAASAKNLLPTTASDGTCSYNCSISSATIASKEHSEGKPSISTSHGENGANSYMSSTTMENTRHSTLSIPMSGIATGSTVTSITFEPDKSTAVSRQSSDRVAGMSTISGKHKKDSSSVTANTNLVMSSSILSFIMPSIANNSNCNSTSGKITVTKEFCNTLCLSTASNKSGHMSKNCNKMSYLTVSTTISCTKCITSPASTATKGTKNATSSLILYKSAASTEFFEAGAEHSGIMESKISDTIVPTISYFIQVTSTFKETAVTIGDAQKSSNIILSDTTVTTTELKTSGIKTLTDQQNSFTNVVKASTSQSHLSGSFSSANTNTGSYSNLTPDIPVRSFTDSIVIPENGAPITTNKSFPILIFLTVVLSVQVIDLL